MKSVVLRPLSFDASVLCPPELIPLLAARTLAKQDGYWGYTQWALCSVPIRSLKWAPQAARSDFLITLTPLSRAGLLPTKLALLYEPPVTYRHDLSRIRTNPWTINGANYSQILRGSGTIARMKFVKTTDRAHISFWRCRRMGGL